VRKDIFVLAFFYEKMKGGMTESITLSLTYVLQEGKMEIEVDGIVVEWDDEKDESNYKKHNIHFSVAAFVFCDPLRIEAYDEKHSEDEERYITIGMVSDVLTVVYTERNQGIRLISARIADKREREDYYEYNTCYC
jgi:uncharacterized DUF497 family protein